MIKSIHLKNFTVFNDVRIDLSNKINIFIGINGTGKTHILKALYAMYKSNVALQNKENTTVQGRKKVVSNIVVDVFRPLDRVLGNLIQTGSKNGAKVEIEYPDGKAFSFAFNANNSASDNHQAIIKLENNTKESSYVPQEGKPVFIPAKELLSIMYGLPALMREYDLSFDMTYSDLMHQLEFPPRKEKEQFLRSKTIMNEIKEICNGEFVFKGGGEVTFKTDKAEYSSNVTAEGYRKLGTLYRLIETGALRPGYGGPLLWDEPDANLNPLQVKSVVEALYSLAQAEQQIVLATHNYNLIKWFDILFDGTREDHVRYHVLHYDEDILKVNSFDNLDSIEPNPILEALTELYDKELERLF